MLDHTGFVVSDLARSRRFYDAIAKALGLSTVDNSTESFILGRSAEEPIPYLWIGTLRPSYWAEGSRPGLNQTHIAFTAPSKAVVDEFYRAALQQAEGTMASLAHAKVLEIIMALSFLIQTATTSKRACAVPWHADPGLRLPRALGDLRVLGRVSFLPFS